MHQSRPTATPPASTTDELFIITGGRILVHLLLGEVTTVIQSQACNLKVTVNPSASGGTSGDVASNLDINADQVGTFYFPEGDGTALVGVNAGTGFTSGPAGQPFIVPVGGIDIETSATNTGAIKWDIWYEALDEAAIVTVS
jgi:hypothetical protein